MKKHIQGRHFLMAATITCALLVGGCTGKQKETAPAVDEKLDHATIESSIAQTEQSTEPETQLPKTPSSEQEPTQDNPTIINDTIPQVLIEQKTTNWYTEDNKTFLLEENYAIVTVTNEGFDNLATSLSRWDGKTSAAYSFVEPLINAVREQYNSLDPNTPFHNYAMEEELFIGRIDASVLSLISMSRGSFGSARDYYGITGFTYDVESGTELDISDLVLDPTSFYEAATDYIIQELQEKYQDQLYDNYADYVAERWTDETLSNYYLDASGIVVVYKPYEIGSYEMGEAQVTLPYAQFGSYMDTRYLPSDGKFVAHVSENVDISSFVGDTSPVMVEVIQDDFEFGGITLISGTASDESVECERFIDAYVIRSIQDKSMLLMSADYASDDYVTVLYTIANNQVQKCGEIQGARMTGKHISTDSIELWVQIDVLGTYAACMTYEIDTNGTLTQSEAIFHINSSYPLLITRELPVTIDDNETTLPVGQTITITGSNNIDTVYFVTDDGQEGTIQYTFQEDEWQHYINGVSEYEYFDMIPYVG